MPIAGSRGRAAQPQPSARETDSITLSRHFQTTVRVLLATLAVAGMALVAVGAAGSAQAAGLRNCTEISGG